MPRAVLDPLGAGDGAMHTPIAGIYQRCRKAKQQTNDHDRARFQSAHMEGKALDVDPNRVGCSQHRDRASQDDEIEGDMVGGCDRQVKQAGQDRRATKRVRWG